MSSSIDLEVGFCFGLIVVVFRPKGKWNFESAEFERWISCSGGIGRLRGV